MKKFLKAAVRGGKKTFRVNIRGRAEFIREAEEPVRYFCPPESPLAGGS